MRHFILYITISFLCYFQSFGQDTLITSGKIFQIWGTSKYPNDSIKGQRSQGMEESLRLYLEKENLMKELMILYPDKKYYKLKRKDKILRKMPDHKIADTFLWGKLDEYDMLLKPGFEFIDINSRWIYVKCNKTQLEQLTNIEKTGEQLTLEFKLKYIGEFYFKNIKGYRLISYAISNDK
jgi:hypothetical protein